MLNLGCNFLQNKCGVNIWERNLKKKIAHYFFFFPHNSFLQLACFFFCRQHKLTGLDAHRSCYSVARQRVESHNFEKKKKREKKIVSSLLCNVLLKDE